MQRAVPASITTKAKNWFLIAGGAILVSSTVLLVSTLGATIGTTIGIAVVVGVFVIAGITYYILKKDKGSSQQSPP